MGRTILTSCSSVLLASQLATAIDFDVNDPMSIKKASRIAADGMMKWYTGDQPGQIPGLLPGPFYWWETGAMFGAMIDYWYYTGDSAYNGVTTEGLLFQVGPNDNYMPPNQTKSLGNDDQAFWGLAVMSAAEVNFPNPPEDQPQWLALAQAVYNTQVPRWDNSTCDGGLRWQIFPLNNGYTYKNAISNGCFFQLAARLGMYTGNTTYLEQATKAWDWTRQSGLLDDNSFIYDGTDEKTQCSEINRIQWSYNAGVYLYGAAVMWNVTQGTERQQWESRTRDMIDGIVPIFFQDGIMTEVACESIFTCNIDQQTFKAYLARWMAASVKVAPFTYDTVMPLLRTSASAAATSCTGGDDGVTCGSSWLTGDWDGAFGVGQQMNALEIFQSNLIGSVNGPLGNSTGGTSAGDYNAGLGDDDLLVHRAIMTGDTVGASILTALAICSMGSGGIWMAI